MIKRMNPLLVTISLAIVTATLRRSARIVMTILEENTAPQLEASWRVIVTPIGAPVRRF